jgi:hypothetical protein
MPRKEIYQKYKEKHLIYMAQYNEKNREKLRQWDKDHPGRKHLRDKKWREKNKEKCKAHQLVANNIKLEKNAKCSLCGKDGKLHKHHENYLEPLKVAVVCPKCHVGIHKEERKNIKGKVI